MFKYLRTLNTEFHPTVVDFYVSPKDDNYPDHVDAGMIVSISDGKITNCFIASKPMYLALTGKQDNEEKPVKCIRLFPGMVLEADISAEANKNSITIGATVGIAENVDFKGIDISADATAKFEVIDDYNKANGKATVVVL